MRIQDAWCQETSSDPDLWTTDNPALGQCAVTALVVQDLLGGSLVRVVNEGVSHYYNSLDDHTRIDLTRSQFETWTPSCEEIRDREYVLSFPATVRRYEVLRSRLGL